MDASSRDTVLFLIDWSLGNDIGCTALDTIVGIITDRRHDSRFKAGIAVYNTADYPQVLLRFGSWATKYVDAVAPGLSLCFHEESVVNALWTAEELFQTASSQSHRRIVLLSPNIETGCHNFLVATKSLAKAHVHVSLLVLTNSKPCLSSFWTEIAEEDGIDVSTFAVGAPNGQSLLPKAIQIKTERKSAGFDGTLILGKLEIGILGYKLLHDRESMPRPKSFLETVREDACKPGKEPSYKKKGGLKRGRKSRDFLAKTDKSILDLAALIYRQSTKIVIHDFRPAHALREILPHGTATLIVPSSHPTSSFKLFGSLHRVLRKSRRFAEVTLSGPTSPFSRRGVLLAYNPSGGSEHETLAGMYFVPLPAFDEHTVPGSPHRYDVKALVHGFQKVLQPLYLPNVSPVLISDPSKEESAKVLPSLSQDSSEYKCIADILTRHDLESVAREALPLSCPFLSSKVERRLLYQPRKLFVEDLQIFTIFLLGKQVWNHLLSRVDVKSVDLRLVLTSWLRNFVHGIGAQTAAMMFGCSMYTERALKRRMPLASRAPLPPDEIMHPKRINTSESNSSKLHHSFQQANTCNEVSKPVMGGKETPAIRGILKTSTQSAEFFKAKTVRFTPLPQNGDDSDLQQDATSKQKLTSSPETAEIVMVDSIQPSETSSLAEYAESPEDDQKLKDSLDIETHLPPSELTEDMCCQSNADLIFSDQSSRDLDGAHAEHAYFSGQIHDSRESFDVETLIEEPLFECVHFLSQNMYSKDLALDCGRKTAQPIKILPHWEQAIVTKTWMKLPVKTIRMIAELFQVVNPEIEWIVRNLTIFFRRVTVECRIKTNSNAPDETILRQFLRNTELPWLLHDHVKQAIMNFNSHFSTFAVKAVCRMYGLSSEKRLADNIHELRNIFLTLHRWEENL